MAATKRKSGIPGINPHVWEGVFPEDQKSEDNRLKFLARMTYIAFAHYLLYRKVVKPGAYKRRRVEDIILYCFDASKRWGAKLAAMLRGIKDAIEKKYLETAFIMLGENKDNPKEATEVFTVRYCYDKEDAFAVLDDDGNPLISMGYKGEAAFRHDVKHLIMKLNAVVKKLDVLGPDVKPELKLTYYPETPQEYEPPYFKPTVHGMYTFASKPTFYHLGSLTTNESAIAINIKSVYLTDKDTYELDDILFDGLEHEQYIDTGNISYMSGEFDLNSPAHVPESPLVPEENEETKNADEPGDEEIEVHRDDGGGVGAIRSPLALESPQSAEIHPDETTDKEEDEQQITPPSRPLKRKITPRVTGRIRMNMQMHRSVKPKLSDSTHHVEVSPEDHLVYANDE